MSLNFLMGLRMDGLHEFVVVRTEREDITQERVVLGVGAVRVGELQERQTAFVEREHRGELRQVACAKRRETDSEFGNLEFLVVERHVRHHLLRHGNLLGSGAVNDRLRVMIMTVMMRMVTTATRRLSDTYSC